MNKWIFTILAKAVAMASPGIIEDLRRMVDEMMKKAIQTPNPWDDIIVGLLQMIIGKPGDPQEPPRE